MKEKELLLVRLVERMFEKQQTFLLLDELYEDEIIGAYIRNIQIDSPYQQLLFEGVISQFLQGEELVVNITVENYFHHLLGLILQNDDRYQSSETLIQLVQSNNLKGVKEGVSNLLGFEIEGGNFNRITQLIDLSEGNEAILEICLMPLVNVLLIHGVEKIIEVILENPTENDWNALLNLDTILENLQLHSLRNDLLKALMPFNQLQTKNEVWLGLKAITLFDENLAISFLTKVDVSAKVIQNNNNLLFMLGLVEQKFGNYDKSIKYYEKSLLIELKNLGNQHPVIAISYNNIGYLYYEKGEYEKALEYYKLSLAIKLKAIGYQNYNIAGTYNNIGLIYYSKGECEKAIEYYLKSLDIQFKTLGSQNPEIATVYNNIGLVWSFKKNHNKALEYYKKSLSIRLKIFGNNHPDVAQSYNNIGFIYYEKGEYEKALIHCENSLLIRLKTLGEEHPDVVTTINSIGSIYLSNSEYSKALEYFDKSLFLSISKLGSQHQYVATSYNNIGVVWSKIGEYDKALEYFEKSLKIYSISIGENHYFYGTTCNSIGEALRSKGEYQKALVYYEKCLSIELKTFGENHPDVAKSHNNIGCIFKSLEQYDKAIESFIKGYEILKKGGFPFHIAQCYETLKDHEKALDYYIQSAEIRKEDPEVGLVAQATQESISNAKRLAKELGKEQKLPVWMG
jgi:tetratricopeptide (TPR) repeat protein